MYGDKEYNLSELLKKTDFDVMKEIARKTLHEVIPKKEYNKRFGKMNEDDLVSLLIHIQKFTYDNRHKKDLCIGDILKSIESDDYLWGITRKNDLFLLEFVDYSLPKLTEAYRKYKSEKNIKEVSEFYDKEICGNISNNLF
jgi:hypothetical protein